MRVRAGLVAIRLRLRTVLRPILRPLGPLLLRVLTTVAALLREILAVICTHGLFTSNALERLAAVPQITEIVTTNTVPIPLEKRRPCLKVISIAPVFGEAIWRNYTRQSIADLYTFGDENK